MASEYDSDPPLFVSLGMLVLDELHLPDETVQHDVIGGSGAYSTLGARLAVEDRERRRIPSFVLAGEDFPRGKVEELLQLWGIEHVIQEIADERSTRGKLKYHDWRFERELVFCHRNRGFTDMLHSRQVI